MSFSFGTRVVTLEAAADFPVWNSRFYYRESPNGTSFGFPYWFAIMTASALAAAPWILQSKRFSLRTLLIATTLVAVGSGVIVLSR